MESEKGEETIFVCTECYTYMNFAYIWYPFYFDNYISHKLDTLQTNKKKQEKKEKYLEKSSIGFEGKNADIIF